MSARKWPIYSMPVGGSFTVERPPKQFRTNLYSRARQHGLLLSIKRRERFNPASPFVVKRVA